MSLLVSCNGSDSDPASGDSKGGTSDAVCSATVVDFDTDTDGVAFSSGTLLSTQYESIGLTFSLDSADPKVVDNSVDPSDAVPVSDPLVLGGNSTTGISNSDPLTVTFVEVVNDISLYVIDAETGGGEVQLYDSDDSLIETLTIGSDATGAAQFVES